MKLEGPDHFGNYKIVHPNGSFEKASNEAVILFWILDELRKPSSQTGKREG